MEYNQINSIGKRWIVSYGFANTKETLGYIRSKYSTIPIPGDDTTLDGDSLRSEAAEEKRELIDQLNASLEKTSKQAMTNRKAEEADNLNSVLSRVPLKFYIG